MPHIDFAHTLPSPGPSPGPLDPRADDMLSACPACRRQRIAFLFWGKSRYREQWYGYATCADCGLVFVNPRLPAAALQRKVETSLDACQPFIRRMDFDRLEFARNIIGPVQRLLPPLTPEGRRRRWLDVGCATGTLLDEAARRGYETHGLELNRVKVDWMKLNRPQIRAYQGQLGSLPPGALYDVISIDNVLEHIPTPDEFLQGIRSRLDEQSLLIVRVPNYHNLLRPLLAATGRLPRSFIIDPDAHPLNYSRRPLIELLTRCGFRIKAVSDPLMLSYPLKHVLGELTGTWPAPLRQAVALAYRASFLLDHLIPRGGLDLTILAEKDK